MATAYANGIVIKVRGRRVKGCVQRGEDLRGTGGQDRGLDAFHKFIKLKTAATTKILVLAQRLKESRVVYGGNGTWRPEKRETPTNGVVYTNNLNAKEDKPRKPGNPHVQWECA